MISKKHFQILLTGSGAPGTSGTLFSIMRGALSEGVSVTVLGADRHPNNVPKTMFASIEQLPEADSPDYLLALRSIIDKHRVDLVVPQTTKETAVLAGLGEAQIGAKVLTSAKSAIVLGNDKLRVTETFDRYGLGAPAYRTAASESELLEAVASLGFPLRDVVVKLRDGNGGRGVRIVSEKTEEFSEFQSKKPDGMKVSFNSLLETLSTASDYPQLLVTERLDSPEVSVDVYNGRSGFVAVPRTRDSIRAGISMRTTVFTDQGLSARLKKASQIIGLEGAFGFQLMSSRAGLKIIECNPRIQGSMVASLLSGNNLIWLACRDALEINEKQKISQTWSVATFSRYWGGELEWESGPEKI